MAYPTWSPTPLVGTAPTVSSDGYTAGWPTPPADDPSYAVAGGMASAGSYYFEFTLVTLPAPATYSDCLFGICQNPYVSGSDSGNGAAALKSNSANIVINSEYNPGQVDVRPAQGDVIGVAVSLPNIIWFRVNGGIWNNNASADPATGVGGLSIAGLTMPVQPFIYAVNGSVFSVKINAGQSAYFSTKPALFANWPAAESLILDPISNPGTNALSITGTASSSTVTAIDYNLNNTGTWTALGSLSVTGTLFSGEGPAFSYNIDGSIQVRDHNTPSAVSNSENFSAGTSPAGRIIWQDDFSEYTPDSSSYNEMVAAGWSMSSQSGTTSTVIGTMAGLGGQALIMDSVTNGRVSASFPLPSTVAKGVFIFDFGPAESTEGTYFFGVVMLQSVGQRLLGISPNAAGGATYDTTWVSSGPTVTVTNVSHRFEIGFECSTTLAAADGSASLSIDGTLVGTYTGAVGWSLGTAANGVFDTFFTDNDVFGRDAVTNVKVYDASEELSITDVVASVGSDLAISGTNQGSLATSLDYQIDGTGSWTTFGTYTAGESWLATGPLYEGGQHTIQVRDTDHTPIVSNIYTYVASTGWFTWNGVRLHP